MREVSFLKQRSAAWKRAETLVAGARRADPDELAAHFVELTDDLAYARTFYPAGKTTAFLNELTGRFFALIYRNRKDDLGRVRRFFARDVPLAVRAGHPYLAASFVLFALAFLVGVLSARNDETFARLILSDGYVDMTLDNIAKGDPLGVYKEQNPVVMFLGIAFNNFMVAAWTFASGLFTVAGAGLVLLRNGIMVGVFQDFFVQRGLGTVSFLTIWIHGALEISAIVVCGGAGLMLGGGWLFPGAYPRGEAFRRSARQALYIFLGTVPAIVVAALLESFVTRHNSMPRPVSALIITLSFAYVAWYYIYYPIKVKRALP